MKRLAARTASAVIFLAVTVRGDAPRLRYAIERLNNAEKVTVSEPGAEGTQACFRLTTRLGDWARFNWPRFDATSGLRDLHFQLRRVSEEPRACVVRVLRNDGTEWQSGTIDVDDTWREHVLTPGDFRLFRGGDLATVPPLRLSDVVQFQVVPRSAGAGTGNLLVDEIQFLPDGPAFTAEPSEWRPVLSPDDIEYQRLADLLQRWRLEESRLAYNTEHARRWLADITQIQRLWKTDRELVRNMLHARTFAWQNQPWREEWSRLPVSRVPLSREDYGRQVAEIAIQPAPAIVTFDRSPTLSSARLYEAIEQEAPEVFTEEGASFVRHRIRFTDAKTRQTVFTHVELASEMDVADRVLRMRMRCTGAHLNRTFPLVLRVWTRGPGGRESWADLAPVPKPSASWQDVSFDVSRPARGVRFAPARAWRLSFRVENESEQAQDFVLEAGDVHLAQAEPRVVVRRELIENAMDRVHAARIALYELRDQIAAGEHQLATVPELQRAYLTSLCGIVDRRPWPSAPPAPILVGVEFPAEVMSPERFTTESRTREGCWTVAVRDRSPAGNATRLAVEVLDRTGTLIASGRSDTPTAGVELRIPQPRPWHVRCPQQYRLRGALFDGDEIVAATDRTVALREVLPRYSVPTPTLRHVWRPRQPDCALRWNGAGFFPLGARYTWRDIGETVDEGVALFADLWVDALRDYGFGFWPRHWDVFDARGLLAYASLSPRYGVLESWDDVAGFTDACAVSCRAVRAHADRPSHALMQIGNEVELSAWGADLAAAFPDALYQPIDVVGELIKHELAPTAPVMYVRAGSFRSVPPLPHEDVCGINQYTGRYGGRMDEAGRDLAELAREALFCDRPLMITEWNGPKYSWASSGVGGVSPRGCAYYIERYFRGMVNTPGIVGSSEFTLNWIIAPFEDLTNQTWEQAQVGRPKHTPFGGGRTADHVPLIPPGDAVHGPCFRAMQAFQGPFYAMANTPGRILIAHTEHAADAATELAGIIREFGKSVETRGTEDLGVDSLPGSHVVLLFHPDDACDLRKRLEERGIVEGFPDVQRQLNHVHPSFLLVSASGKTPADFADTTHRLAESARSLLELTRLEGAMIRVLALTDAELVRYYERYILEQAGRGYFITGDDVRTELSAAELYEGDKRRAAWEGLGAVILDCSRELSAEELALFDRFLEDGINVVLSYPCYSANPPLVARFPVTVGEERSLTESLPVTEALRSPLRIVQIGGADVEAIRRFAPKEADSDGLAIREISSDDARAAAEADSGRAVVLQSQRGDARVFLLGCGIGDVSRIHWIVTHRGESHSLYDRETACGLERVAHMVVNCCLSGAPAPRVRPRLHLRILPDRTTVNAGEEIGLTIDVTDAEGRPVESQLRGRTRTVTDGRAGVSSDYVDITPGAGGRFRLTTTATAADGGRLNLASFQFRAYARGYIPGDGAIAIVVGDGETTSEPATSDTSD